MLTDRRRPTRWSRPRSSRSCSIRCCTARSGRSSDGRRGRPRLLARCSTADAAGRRRRAARPRRAADPAHRAVVVGYGPTGRTVVRLLRDNGIAPTVDRAEHGHRAARCARTAWTPSTATRRGRTTLEAAGVARAGSLILTSAGMANSAEVIRAARELNPTLRVLARAGLPARRRRRCSAPAPHASSPARAKWRWPSSRTSSSGWARRRSRSIASGRGLTTSCRAGVESLPRLSPARELCSTRETSSGVMVRPELVHAFVPFAFWPFAFWQRCSSASLLFQVCQFHR